VGSCINRKKEPAARLSAVGVAFKVPLKFNAGFAVLVELLYWRLTPSFDAVMSHAVMSLALVIVPVLEVVIVPASDQPFCPFS